MPMHGPRHTHTHTQGLTCLLLPQLPPYYARKNQPQPKSTTTTTASLNSTRLNSTVKRTEPKSSRVSCLLSRASAQLSSSSFPMACGWHRQQKHENFATNSERNQKNNKLKVTEALQGYSTTSYPGKNTSPL